MDNIEKWIDDIFENTIPVEVLDTRDDLQSWVQEATWEEILEEVITKIKKYIETGKYAEQMKSYEGIGVGFVDGDITIVYQK